MVGEMPVGSDEECNFVVNGFLSAPSLLQSLSGSEFNQNHLLRSACPTCVGVCVRA